MNNIPTNVTNSKLLEVNANKVGSKLISIDVELVYKNEMIMDLVF